MELGILHREKTKATGAKSVISLNNNADAKAFSTNGNTTASPHHAERVAFGAPTRETAAHIRPVSFCLVRAPEIAEQI
jgi:hypothetical protein